jgi:hypothetical protein
MHRIYFLDFTILLTIALAQWFSSAEAKPLTEAAPIRKSLPSDHILLKKMLGTWTISKRSPHKPEIIYRYLTTKNEPHFVFIHTKDKDYSKSPVCFCVSGSFEVKGQKIVYTVDEQMREFVGVSQYEATLVALDNIVMTTRSGNGELWTIERSTLDGEKILMDLQEGKRATCTPAEWASYSEKSSVKKK